jgi:hypothetical protein
MRCHPGVRMYGRYHRFRLSPTARGVTSGARDFGRGGAGAVWGSDVRPLSSFRMSRTPQLIWLALRRLIPAHLPKLTPSEAPFFSPETSRPGRIAAVSRGRNFWALRVCFWGGSATWSRGGPWPGAAREAWQVIFAKRQGRSAEREKSTLHEDAQSRSNLVCVDILTAPLAGSQPSLVTVRRNPRNEPLSRNVALPHRGCA